MAGKIVKVCTEENQHNGDVTCSVFYKNHYFTGGADGKLKIWDNDLNLKREFQAHEAYIYAMAINENSGKLYTSSCDGTIKYYLDPLGNDMGTVLVRVEDEIESLYCVGDLLYSGDDKGVAVAWENDKIKFKYNLIEEVRSLAIEGKNIYSAKGLDTIISQVIDGPSGKYSNAAVIPGKSPLALIGPLIDGKRKYLVFATRDGKGIILVRNHVKEQFIVLWTKEDAHEMIINAFTGNSEIFYSSGYDGVIKKWKDLEKSTPTEMGKVDVGNCINTMQQDGENTVFVGCSNGLVYKISFD